MERQVRDDDIGIGFAIGDKQLWLEIVAATVRDSSDERFSSIRWMFTGYIERLLFIYRDRDVIPSDMDLRSIAHVIHLVYTEAFVDFCAVPERTATEAISQVIATLRQVFSRAWFPQT